MSEFISEYEPYTYEQYIAAQRQQRENARNFIAEVTPGETYRIERYAITEVGIPHALTRYAHLHDKRTVTICAVNKNNGAHWFTTTTGEAIDADTLIKWERLPKQGELFA